jgi:hypothetical protein
MRTSNFRDDQLAPPAARRPINALAATMVQLWHRRRHQSLRSIQSGRRRRHLRHQGPWPLVLGFTAADAAVDDESRWRPTDYADDSPHRRSRSTRRGGLPVDQALGTTRPHALAPLVMALMGSQDPCLGEDSAIINLLLILQNWCS